MLWIDSRTGKVYHEIIQNFRGRDFWSMPAEKQRKGVLMMIELSDVRQAQERITPYILRTPLLRQPALDPILGCQVYLKHEGLQFTGSFKLRGATNALLSLTEEERSRGVVAASSGNHAQGVACAAQRLGVDAVIVMPTNVNPVKLEGCKAFGARTMLVGTLSSEREAAAAHLVETEGRVFIHPFDNAQVSAGQGTIGLEVLEDEPEMDAVVVPIGGGGLISGIATAVKGLSDHCEMVGVEPAGAPRYAKSLEAGHPVQLDHVDTIADGTRTDHGVERNCEVIRQRVDRLAQAEDEWIKKAVKLLVSKAKIVAEPSSVMGVAAVLGGGLKFRSDQKVCFVLSGGNNDLGLLARWLQEKD